jgi:hypothetical protein
MQQQSYLSRIGREFKWIPKSVATMLIESALHPGSSLYINRDGELSRRYDSKGRLVYLRGEGKVKQLELELN